jgi:hypothetical protein
VTNYRRVKREFRLLKKKWCRPVKKNPKKAHQPQSPIGELVFRLPPRVRAPVLVESFEMRHSANVSPERELSKLWNRDTKCLTDPPQSRVKGILRGRCQLLQKVSTIRIANSAYRAIRLAY